jgi:cytochrome c oxidase subunit 2
VVANLASLKYIPWAAASGGTGGEAEVQVDFTAKSWAYDISNRQIEAGKPVRFSGRASRHPARLRRLSPGRQGAVHHADDAGHHQAHVVVYTFKEPGKYAVRCLEYCGVAHHRMQDELTVVKAN